MAASLGLFLAQHDAEVGLAKVLAGDILSEEELEQLLSAELTSEGVEDEPLAAAGEAD